MTLMDMIRRIPGMESTEIKEAREFLSVGDYKSALKVLGGAYRIKINIPKAVTELRKEIFKQGIEHMLEHAHVDIKVLQYEEDPTQYPNFDQGQEITSTRWKRDLGPTNLLNRDNYEAVQYALHTAKEYAKLGGLELPEEFPYLEREEYRLGILYLERQAQSEFESGDFHGARVSVIVVNRYASESSLEVPESIKSIGYYFGKVDARNKEISEEYEERFNPWYAQLLEGRTKGKNSPIGPTLPIEFLESFFIDDAVLQIPPINPEKILRTHWDNILLTREDAARSVYQYLTGVKSDAKESYSGKMREGINPDEAFGSSVGQVRAFIQNFGGFISDVRRQIYPTAAALHPDSYGGF